MELSEGNTPATSGPGTSGYPDAGTAGQSAAPPDASPESAGHEDRGDRDTLIMGKYRTAEELVKAHRHLESKLGDLGRKASVLERAAARWADDQGRALTPEEFVRRAEMALRQGGKGEDSLGSSSDRVMPRNTALDEMEKRLNEYDAILGQLYVEREKVHLKEKFPDYEDEILEFCLSRALPGESPEELARFIARQRQAGADHWARGKLKAQGLATEREGASSPPVLSRRLSFRSSGQAVSPLEAWMAEPPVEA